MFKSVSQRTIAVQFGVTKSTVGNINKNRDAILKSWEETCFNADETGLFYRQMPRKSLIQKGEKCKGGKLSKERLCSFLL
jgi:hypothetical protein